MNNLTAKIIARCGIIKIVRWINKTPRVLCYHGVDEKKDDYIQILQDNPLDFEREIRYLTKNFDVISADELYNRHTSNKLNGREVVITFDDGYRNNLTIAAPILKKYNAPFLVFVSCRNISNGDYFHTLIIRSILLFEKLAEVKIECIGIDSKLTDREQRINLSKKVASIYKYSDWELAKKIVKELQSNISASDYKIVCDRYRSEAPLNWDEVRELKKYGATIGSHCYDHFICHQQQPIEEIRFQIVESKKFIEQQMGEECNYFAFPNGGEKDMSIEALSFVKEAGYKLGFSTLVIPITSEVGTLIPRIGTTGNLDLFKIRLNLMPPLFNFHR